MTTHIGVVPTREALDRARANLIRRDIVHHSQEPRAILLELLRSNPSNALARNYLLCYDLLRYDQERHHLPDWHRPYTKQLLTLPTSSEL